MHAFYPEQDLLAKRKIIFEKKQASLMRDTPKIYVTISINIFHARKKK
jgi:hypothetical protein